MSLPNPLPPSSPKRPSDASGFRSAIGSLSLLVVFSVLAATLAPALAHQVQVAQDVGATLHIEPNDMPQAGTPSQVWFALTLAGGQSVPLADCDCTLILYDAQGAVVDNPTLEPVSAEDYRQIPGAMVTFPTVGAYELVLAGQPQGSGNFTPFELQFPVLVAAGQTVKAGQTVNQTAASGTEPEDAVETTADTTAPAETPASSGEPAGAAPTSSRNDAPWGWQLPLLGAMVLLGGTGTVLYRLRSRGQKP
ncbi:hypothetical protein [Leptolyngbya sp. PCC 6406]|uniref:hypothetical protein n=1 Tax=Leptolyngbya sp. PCC 6406 TaxID=1173264 RepID=UPI0002AC2FCF|nr:hypothetical protein [Leptolyngbya sp. PCC 6406]